MDREQARQIRLRLLENGYSPIRNRDKATYLKDWPSLEITPEVIDEWARRHGRDLATGLRVENGLVAVDIDIDDGDVVERLADALLEIAPELQDEAAPWLERSSGRAKVAWFFRVDEPFGRLHSRRWTRPGETLDDGSHVLEVFGGASSRQMGAFGPHTLAANGEVLRSYAWRDQSPLDVPLDRLPVLTKKQLAALVDEAERILSEAGWSPVALTAAGENVAERVYDLAGDMVFDVHEGDRGVSLEALKALVTASDEGVRVSASWLEGPDPKRSPDRCLVSLTRAGFLAIWDSATGVTHVEAEAAPVDFGPEIDRIGEKLKELAERRRLKIKTADDMTTAVAKMLDVYAYCPHQQNDVVPLWASSPEDGKPVAKFRLEMLPNAMEEVGPRGGRRLINPVDVWLRHERRTVVAGLRMRPDKPRPTFEEDGRLYVNCYDPPLHIAEGGSAAAGIEFMEHLIPDAVEREWFLDWLAFKARYPHIPGPAVVMVAHRTFGTGRGTLGVLMSRLFGERYVRSIPFAAFTGRTYQSQYNEWQADTLVVMVNESSEDTEGSTYRTKRNTYEHLKETVEVRPTVREISVKGRSNYRAMSSTSFIIATNHADALPIPDTDRRFCVIRNGGTKPLSWWTEVNDWLYRPENVAAFHAWLGERDLSGYSPFDTPPVFEGKRAMTEEAKSDFDRLLEAAVDSLPGPVFVAAQVERQMRALERTSDTELPKGFELPNMVKRALRKECVRIGVPRGQNWWPMVNGRRYTVFARTHQDAAKWTSANASLLRDTLLQNGDPDANATTALLSLDGLRRE
ncbi:MAG: primase-helicase family protein [Novosphingobium sp.]